MTVVIKNAARYISIDAPLVQGEEENMYDVLLNEDASSPDKELLTDSLMKDIERVRQIKARAITRLKYTTICRVLKTYLG